MRKPRAVSPLRKENPAFGQASVRYARRGKVSRGRFPDGLKAALSHHRRLNSNKGTKTLTGLVISGIVGCGKEQSRGIWGAA